MGTEIEAARLLAYKAAWKFDRGEDIIMEGAMAKLFGEVFETEDSQIGVASFLEHGPGKADFVGR